MTELVLFWNKDEGKFWSYIRLAQWLVLLAPTTRSGVRTQTRPFFVEFACSPIAPGTSEGNYSDTKSLIYISVFLSLFVPIMDGKLNLQQHREAVQLD